ncbi:MAG TPA: hypothetical protein VFW53_04175 [Gallionella sp.]|nr:hypothetical protein [Gallionella sp.]
MLDCLNFTSFRRLFCLLGAVLTFSAQAAGADANAPGGNAKELEIGRRIYQEGILPSGAPMKGMRKGGAMVSGAAAACSNCHRRSGMGSVEGDIQVPPITGKFLFAQPGDKAMATMDPRSGKRMNQAHEPYTDQALVNAIRRGVNNRGQQMNLAMPRYALGQPAMQALFAYLKQLSAAWSPGVDAEVIHFATVITPDVEPEQRKALLEMMRTAFAQKNGSTATWRSPAGRRHMTSAAELVLGTERNWKLDVWELQGAPETWSGQLEDFYRRQPVFAILSGMSNGTWEPVHHFCEREQVPCWFPSVDLPPGGEGAFYPVYFSRGVALEADVLAKYLQATSGQRPQRLVQVYRDDYVGRGAAQALRHALAGSGIAVEDRILHDGEPDALNRAVADINATDSLMFWLRPADLHLLDSVAPPAATAYFSARLSGGERGPFPAVWKNNAHLVYPYELPEKRADNLAYLHKWLQMRGLPLVDEPRQAEIYFALNYMTDTVAEMLDNLYRDYLMERAESMISRRESSKAEEETRDRSMLGWRARSLANRQSDLAREGAMQAGTLPATPSGKSESTTVYPRLSLGPTQRFASKGGYIVRFSGGDSGKLVAESDWIVP